MVGKLLIYKYERPCQILGGIRSTQSSRNDCNWRLDKLNLIYLDFRNYFAYGIEVIPTKEIFEYIGRYR